MGNNHPHHHDHDQSHDQGHGHDHQGGASHAQHASYGKLLVSFWIIAAFMVVEIVCGWLFHSLTLMSDGFHMLSDAVSLGLSAAAVSLGSRKATEAKTFGFKRLEILAAFGNGLTLILLSLLIAGQAVTRLFHPQRVEAGPMLWVACAGLVVNLAVAWWLHRGGHEKTVNEEGAFWHVVGDLGASVCAVAAAILILEFGWIWADPVLSLALSAAIIVPGIRVLRRSGHILVEGTPEGVQIETMRSAMLSDPRVRSVHDLHVWTMNGRDLYLSAHVEIAAAGSTGNPEKAAGAEKEAVAALTRSLNRDFHVDHITLQVGLCVDDDCLNRHP
ncbi:MAG: cation diffusion facilitator family transporter [Fibrobacteria bacterium]